MTTHQPERTAPSKTRIAAQIVFWVALGTAALIALDPFSWG